MLRESGYLPELFACVSCGTAVDAGSNGAGLYFSASLGGLVCRNCESATPDRMEIDPRLIRMVQSILRLPRANGSPQRLPQLTRHQTDPINRMFVEQIQHTLGKRLRLSRYIF
jgi:recombinational DNA repair protein (RecF pathway)